MNWTEIKDWVIPVLTILGAILVQVIGWWRWRMEFPTQEKKAGAESQNLLGEGAESIASAAKTLIEPLEKKVNEQNEKIEKLEKKVSFLEDENYELRREGRRKDARIAELETKTASQEKEISELRKQIEYKGDSK